MIKKSAVKMSLLAVLCSAYSVGSHAAPVPEVLHSALLAGSPPGSTVSFPYTEFSEDGRFLLLSANVGVFGSSSSLNRVYDLYSGKFIAIGDFYTASNRMRAMSASGRYILTGENSSSQTSIVDLKFGSSATGFPRDSRTVSDDGRHIGYTLVPSGTTVTHGYVHDIAAGSGTLATPKHGTSNQLVTAFGGVPSDILLSGDGKTFFWGTDGNTGFSANKPTKRDLIAHKWGVGSTVNPRVSNCNNCSDAVTDKGSDAYQYSVSADGNIAAFRGYGDYGYTTSTGDTSNGRYQIYTRNLTTLKVDLISADDDGFIEPNSTSDNYQNPSLSSDGRFVVFNGDGKTYIRDRFANKKQVLDSASFRATISGNGKSILLQKTDGWYTIANPYLVTTTNFASNYLFGNILLVGNTWNNFDHMLLTANNTWTGFIDYSGTGSSTVKLNFAGQWDGAGNYVPAVSPGTDFGDNNADGTAALGEAAISLTQGAGRYKVTFNDVTNQYSIKKLVNVNFNCYNGYTTTGQSVYVTGNIPELGNWAPANAVKLSPTSYPTWSGGLALPTNTSIEWKCIKRDELNPAASLVWESGSNNQFNPSSSQTTDGHF